MTQMRKVITLQIPQILKRTINKYYKQMGIPWLSSGQESVHSLPKAFIRSPCCAAKKKKIMNKCIPMYLTIQKDKNDQSSTSYQIETFKKLTKMSKSWSWLLCKMVELLCGVNTCEVLSCDYFYLHHHHHPEFRLAQQMRIWMGLGRNHVIHNHLLRSSLTW